MLVLKRKVGETVVIDGDIRVQVLGVEGETVKLGFIAPQQIEIMREELFESIKKENMEAGTTKMNQTQLMELLHKVARQTGDSGRN